MTLEPAIHPSWKEELSEQFSKPYFLQIKKTLLEEKKQGILIYPPGNLIFNAFNLTPFDEVKVVIIGQDPYHGTGQAHGLSFSVPFDTKAPPSLKNIFAELHDDLQLEIPGHGNLTSWAKQGVLLLNAILTVQASKAASHKHIGWEEFTDGAITKLSEKRAGLVFLLWGKFAEAKKTLIDENKHYVLTAPHPSPFSAHSGFFGCKHFSKANEILQHEGYNPIDWQLQTKAVSE
ncbi:MAG: uracil-DNA glycosylase [Chitinophagales bacterium]|nr:uracil-DNA glycosylase [Chitinophagales bacterium]